MTEVTEDNQTRSDSQERARDQGWLEANTGASGALSSSVARNESGDRQGSLTGVQCTGLVEPGSNQCHGSQNHIRAKVRKVQESQRKQRSLSAERSRKA